ncbi:hypothetical protein AAAY25_08340 [Brotaphodocola catenula]|jgi:hypothetical protein
METGKETEKETKNWKRNWKGNMKHGIYRVCISEDDRRTSGIFK